jgi:hypothetical protein
MTPTQEARDLVWLVLNASPRSNMDDLARGVQAIIDAAEERGAGMALEAAAKKEPSQSETHAYQQAGYQDGWRAAINAMRSAIRQIDPASLGAE